MMNDRIGGPVETWRGIDPQWRECGGLSYDNLLVRAPCGAVVQALQEDGEMPNRVADLFTGFPSDVRGSVVFVYQLRGHEWTQVQAAGDAIVHAGIAETLSRRLNAQAFSYSWQDVAASQCYVIYERGEMMEALGWLYDNPVYQGEQGEKDLRRKKAEGWQISQDHTFEFFTRRGVELDVESPEACYGRLDQVVAELGMFVAAHPFWFDERGGGIERDQEYDSEPFSEAKVLYQTEADLVRKPEGNDDKLILVESSEEWRALQEVMKRFFG